MKRLFLVLVVLVSSSALAADQTPNSSRLTINLALGTHQYIDMESAGATTAVVLTNPTAKTDYVLVFQQSTANANRLLTWPSNVSWTNGAAPALTAVADALDAVTCTYWPTAYYTCTMDTQAALTVGGNYVAVSTSATSTKFATQAGSAIGTTLSPSGSTQTINWNTSNVQYLDLESASATVTLTLSNPIAGFTYAVIVQQSTANPNRALAWPNTVKWPGGAVPVVTATADAVDTFYCTWTGSVYLCDQGADYR